MKAESIISFLCNCLFVLSGGMWIIDDNWGDCCNWREKRESIGGEEEEYKREMMMIMMAAAFMDWSQKKRKYSCVYMMMTTFALQLKLASWSQGECHPCNWHLCCTSNAISPLWLLPARFSHSFFFLFNGVLGVDAYLVHEISLFSSSRDFLEEKWDFHRFRVAVLYLPMITNHFVSSRTS